MELRNIETPFLFDSLGSKLPRSSRRAHIRRLVDILQVSIHRHDWLRAQRAWCILVRCKEFEWKTMWKTGLLLAGSFHNTPDLATAASNPQRLEYLRVMMLRCPDHRAPILQEIILHLICSDRHQDALDELELYLPSSPYQDNPVLHIYAGLLRLFLAQASGKPLFENLGDSHYDSPAASPHTINQDSVRESISHFQRALDMDPGNPVASEFLANLPNWFPPEDSDGGNETEDPIDPEFRPHQPQNVAEKRPQKRHAIG